MPISADERASVKEQPYLLRSPAKARRRLESIAEPAAGGSEVHGLIRP